MPGLRLHPANHADLLFEQFAEVLAVAPLDDPMEAVQVVVPGPAVEHWLRLRLASRFGSCAFFSFITPARLAGELAPSGAGARPSLADAFEWWLLARLLRADPTLPSFLRKAAPSSEPAECHACAADLARTFGRYARHAPAWLLRWENEGGQQDDWQAGLWHAFSEEFPPAERPSHWHPERQRAPSGAHSSPLHVFLIHHLPGPQLDWLRRSAETRAVHWYRLEPSELDWHECVRSRKVLALEGVLSPEGRRSARALLASWGRSPALTLRRLLDAEAQLEDGLFTPGNTTSLLGWLQGDLRTPEQGSPAPSPDGSLVVAACAGPRRELEVLHDALLRAFAELPGLGLRDVLVLLADPETYGPLVPAVFDTRLRDGVRPSLPWRLAEQTSAAASPLGAAFLGALELAAGRMPAAAVLEWLERPAVRARLGLTDRDLERLDAWVRRLGVAWGRDGEHQASLGLPRQEQTTWRQALRALVLGAAMPPAQDQLFQGVAPFEAVEGDAVDLADLLLEALEFLEETAAALAQPRTPAAWAEVWKGALAWLGAGPELDPRALTALTGAVDSWLSGVPATVAELALPHPAALASLRPDLESPQRAQAGSSGGITFAALRPGRVLPARVVCVLGLSDGQFPATSPSPGYDRLAVSPPPKNVDLPPAARDEAGQLLLECVLAAGDRLHLSYQGLNPADLTEEAPALLLSELIEHVQAALPEDQREGFRQKHPLQAHSHHTFVADAPATFDAEAWHCARIRSEPPSTRPPVIALAKSLTPPATLPATLELETLLHWVRRPAQAFLKRRLGLANAEELTPAAECERFVVDGLARYGLLASALERSFPGSSVHGDLRLLWEFEASRGSLPPGALRPDAEAALEAATAQILSRVPSGLQVAEAEALPVQLSLPCFGKSIQLSGTLRGLRGPGQLRLRAGKVREGDVLAAWLEHLVLLLARRGTTSTTVVAGTDSSVLFQNSPGDPAEALARWVELCVCADERPVPYLPQTSTAFARASEPLRGPRLRKSAAQKAAEAFETEREDESVALLFPGDGAFLEGELFSTIALQLVQPALLQAQADGEAEEGAEG